MNEWKKSILDFIEKHKTSVLQLKQLEADVRQQKKSIEGTKAAPTEYTVGKQMLMENWDTIIELANAQDEDIKLVSGGTNPKLLVMLDDGQIELSVTTRKTVDANSILDQLVLDGKITATELTKYKEENTKTSKSFSIK